MTRRMCLEEESVIIIVFIDWILAMPRDVKQAQYRKGPT